MAIKGCADIKDRNPVRANREPVTPDGAATPLQFWACHLTALTVEIDPNALGHWPNGFRRALECRAK